MRVILLTKENIWCNLVRNYLESLTCGDLEVLSSSEKYRKFPETSLDLKGDLLISFLSPWLVPGKVLGNFEDSINFHPGPPEYPGTGCYNFAIYESANVYGVTCHHMTASIDDGEIIAVRRFPLGSSYSVKTLQERTLSELLVLFYQIMDIVASGSPLPSAEERWKRKATTKNDLEELCRITPEITELELRRRIKALSYPGMPGVFLELHGYRFDFENFPQREVDLAIHED